MIENGFNLTIDKPTYCTRPVVLKLYTGWAHLQYYRLFRAHYIGKWKKILTK